MKLTIRCIGLKIKFEQYLIESEISNSSNDFQNYYKTSESENLLLRLQIPVILTT
jgi:hypothetical protein